MKKIFDKKIKRIHRNRAAKNIQNHGFLLCEANSIFEENLNETITEKFSHALNIGCASNNLHNIKGIEKIVYLDTAINMLKNNSIVADEELLPFQAKSFNLITSNLLLHWTNNLPSCLKQIHNLLKNRGLFMAIILGGNTLYELREASISAEASDGISPRVSPFVHVKDAGALLQQAAFHIPVADSQKITVMYDNAMDLFRDLRAMGESNATIERHKQFTSIKRLTKITEHYSNIFEDKNGQIPATFEFITLTGWKN